jgi:hypothetical protein
MASVQSSIRIQIKCGEFPAPKGAEAFAAYAIASAKGLIPEMEDAARLTLNHPMTFETLGEGLRLFEGWALRDLVDFRKRCRDGVIASLSPFIEVQHSGPSRIWVNCPEAGNNMAPGQNRALPKWLKRLLSRNQNDLKTQTFTHSLDIHSRIRQEYITALQTHSSCTFCLGIHLKKGSTFCAELETKLTQGRDKVRGDRGSHLGLTYPSPRNQ